MKEPLRTPSSDPSLRPLPSTKHLHPLPQRLAAGGSSPGLRYFGQSLHGVLDVNGDGLVELAVGALGAAVIVWSRGVVRIEASLTFEPQKINVFNKDCRRGGKEVTCMSAIVCLSLDTRSGTRTRTGTRTDVGEQHNALVAPYRQPQALHKPLFLRHSPLLHFFLNNFPINSYSKILRL